MEFIKKIIFFIIGVALLIGGYVWYTTYGTLRLPNDPVEAYAKIKDLSFVDQIASFKKLMNTWNQDKGSLVPYPKGWRKTSVTINKETFQVITSDEKDPPAYYVSTAFPKKYIKQVTVARCLNLEPKKITDWCVIGDNEQINAYFNMIQWAKENSVLNGESLLKEIAPQMNF